MFNHSPNGKGMVYGSSIMAPMGHTVMVYSPNGKGMVFERLFFDVVIVMIKD